MTTTITTVLVIIGCMLVTWIPRIVPFLLVKKLELPDVLLRWLKYIPVCILSALVFESLFDEAGHVVTFDWLNLGAAIPTLLVAIWTKSLSKTVLVGVASMALLRVFL